MMMLLFAGIDLKSQTPAEAAPALNYTGLEVKLKKSDADILNEKKNTKAKTWTARSQVFMDIFNVHNDLLSRGMDPMAAKLFMKDPKEIQTSQDGADKIETYVYERVNLVFKNGKLDKWVETSKIHPDPLPEAEKALNEAIKLNADGKADAEILKIIEDLKMSFQIEAINAYENKEFGAAHDNFVKILDLNKLPQMKGRVDTILIYYAGRAAFENKDFKESNRLFEETASHNFVDPLLYVFRKQSYFGSGDTAKGVEVIRDGFNKFPEDQSIMIELINYYIDADLVEEALEMIAKAKAGDPENISYFFTEGTLFDRLGRFEEAEKAYKSCLEKNPDYFDANYNLGVLYYNRAVKVYEEASKIMDNTEFDKKQKEGDEILKQVIPYMEKASVVNPAERSSLETLKTVYYRLKMEDKREEVVKKLNAM
jgi:tetratricopeptide (TPR) repeat protein